MIRTLTGYAALAARIDAPGNRHRRDDKATVMIGYQGGFTRYAWLERLPSGQIIVTLFGYQIVTVDPDAATFDPCRHFTDCTRDAMGAIVSIMCGRRQANNYAAALTRPGLNGADTDEPWRLTIRVGGNAYVMSSDGNPASVTIPAEAFA